MSKLATRTVELGECPIFLDSSLCPNIKPPTIDGYGKKVQINYRANFLLIHQLIRNMRRENGRIVFVTSFSHDPTSRYARAMPLPRHLWMPVDDLAWPPHDVIEHKSKAGLRPYATSKMCLMMLMHSIQDCLDTCKELRNITTVAVDLGWITATQIMREQSLLYRFSVGKVLNAFTPILQRIFAGSLVRTPSRSAADILHISVPLQGQTKADRVKSMVINGPRVQESSEESRDKKKQATLQDISVLLAGLNQADINIFKI
ncbi:hypothetical protein K505DRAFT_319017 [Melanomma pulvis-pyrius CBS 109.77]|uniref:NAD(P)-binding protein n=1 Tax=Melanomma pulvis-pyrius CBS 109.77 TaxID=1314802 RepID=A0A6A6WQH7_9PLEO|nr:hypothetical protein K505DRAFT_319017 [Melanomma pulvis-pyrius CBS 109.77]